MNELFKKYKLCCGRMISGNKRSPEGNFCVWNANIIVRSVGKVWHGDLNITKEGPLLKQIAYEFGEHLYVLREHDCRFDTENDPIELLISRAVWDTSKD